MTILPFFDKNLNLNFYGLYNSIRRGSKLSILKDILKYILLVLVNSSYMRLFWIYKIFEFLVFIDLDIIFIYFLFLKINLTKKK